MDLHSGRYIRIVAIISLLLGLNDAARLLGVSLGRCQPDLDAGRHRFHLSRHLLPGPPVRRRGLWIQASWGAVLLVGATAVELVMFLMGSRDVQLSMFGFGMRLVLLMPSC